MSSYFNPELETMTLDEMYSAMNSLCTRINSAKGFVSTFDDNYIGDLRRRSKGLGREILLEVDPSVLAYVVNPARLF